MAFSHGSNDVANAIGPVAAVLSIINSGEISQSSPVPVYVLFVGAIGIVIGLATFGVRVIKTVGEKITELRPSRGFAAELAAASTVVLASYTGVPISTTHTLVARLCGEDVGNPPLCRRSASRSPAHRRDGRHLRQLPRLV